MNLRVMSAAALLLGATAYGGMSGSAQAADLGGDCCADLEERVAELEATTARKGNRRVSLAISGQVTQALMFWDDGDDSDVYVIDPQTSNSRFRFTGSAKISPSLSAGFNIEVAAGLSASSTGVTQDDDDTGGGGDGPIAVRLAHWYLDHKQLGRVTVGRINMATDGVAQIDLGGANIVAQSGMYFANDFQVIGAAAGPNGRWDFYTGGNFNFELDRNNAVRYDTANFGGFVASASWGEDDRWDATLRYAGEFSGFRLAAGIGYGYGDDNSDFFALPAANIVEREFLTGSASILHVSSGLFVSASASTRDNELDNGTDFTEDSWSVRGGVSKNYFGIGKTVLYGEYHNFENSNNTDASMDIWGLGVVQNIDAASMELFLAYKNYSVDDPQFNTEDLDLVITGARIRF